jgi:hypothetical protein
VIALRKARRTTSVHLSVKLPPPRIREKFLITYELEGCKTAVNYLSKYYSVKRMRIVLNSKKVKKKCLALYSKNCAYFKKEGLKKPVVLHELYHHLVASKGFELATMDEEKEANSYAREFVHMKPNKQ